MSKIKVVKYICSVCGSEDCDGIDYRCTECGDGLCTGSMLDSYREYPIKSKSGYHLCGRGYGHYWHCGPVIESSKWAAHLRTLTEPPTDKDALHRWKATYMKRASILEIYNSKR